MFLELLTKYEQRNANVILSENPFLLKMYLLTSSFYKIIPVTDTFYLLKPLVK